MHKASFFKPLALILSLALASTSVGAFASPNVYVRSNGQFVANGNEYPRGFWIPSVNGAEEAFRSNPAALEEYQAHLEDAKWFGILNWGALGLFLVYSTVSLSNERYNGGVALLSFLVPWGVGLYFGAASNRHLLKAINLANGVPANEARGEFQPNLLPHPQNAPELRVSLLSFSF